MTQPNASRTYEMVHAHLLWWLLAAYAFGAFLPGLGIWIRGVFPDQLIPGDNYSGGLLKGMLAVLLFNAGLGIDLNAVKQMGRRLALLFVMPIVGFVVPAIYLVAISLFMSDSLSPEMVYALLFGVAVVGAMPSAASSTGWAQASGGNMALSCGLVVTTTLFSPLSIWLMLGLVGLILPGGGAFPTSTYATVAVIAIWGLIPMGIGMAARQGIGNDSYDQAKPYIKLTSVVVILLLNYTNASLSLPRIVEQPHWRSVALITLVMLGLCVVQYSVAHPLAKLFRTKPSEQTSLYFSSGMRNNGAGLVLITSCMAQYEIILLPVIIYTLLQHLAAGVINRVRRKAASVK